MLPSPAALEHVGSLLNKAAALYNQYNPLLRPPGVTLPPSLTHPTRCVCLSCTRSTRGRFHSPFVDYTLASAAQHPSFGKSNSAKAKVHAALHAVIKPHLCRRQPRRPKWPNALEAICCQLQIRRDVFVVVLFTTPLDEVTFTLTGEHKPHSQI